MSYNAAEVTGAFGQLTDDPGTINNYTSSVIIQQGSVTAQIIIRETIVSDGNCSISRAWVNVDDAATGNCIVFIRTFQPQEVAHARSKYFSETKGPKDVRAVPASL